MNIKEKHREKSWEWQKWDRAEAHSVNYRISIMYLRLIESIFVWNAYQFEIRISAKKNENRKYEYAKWQLKMAAMYIKIQSNTRFS